MYVCTFICIYICIYRVRKYTHEIMAIRRIGNSDVLLIAQLSAAATRLVGYIGWENTDMKSWQYVKEF